MATVARILIFVAGEPRTYDDPCGIARALDAIGERWAVLVVRELILGPKRFNQLRRGLPGPSPNVLSQRLRELEHAGIVRRNELEPPASVAVYELTERGKQLEPVLLELGRWGSRQPLASAKELRPDALLLALKTTFSPRAARNLEAEWALVLDGKPYRISVSNGVIDVTRGRASDPIAGLDTNPATLRSLAFGGADLATALTAGDITITGTRRSVARLLGLFNPPAAA